MEEMPGAWIPGDEDAHSFAAKGEPPQSRWERRALPCVSASPLEVGCYNFTTWPHKNGYKFWYSG